MSSSDESTPSWEQWAIAGTEDERRRLQLIERAYDRYTIANLERVGVAHGWRCLEVGAGAGSVAVWLAERAGPANVIATELFPQYLGPVARLGVRVVRHDVTVDPPFDTEFDLVHARVVLEHITQREQVLARLASWLAPGGWLVVEDASVVPAAAASPAVRRVEEAMLQLLGATTGSDLDWARTFPLPLERAGLTETSAEVIVPVLRGGGPVAVILDASVRATAPGMLARGLVTAGEIEEVYDLYADPSFVDCSFLVVVAWGRRPATG